MNNLEEQADNAKARELFWKPFSWLGAIRPTSANDAFDPALWETPSHASIIARLLSAAAKSSRSVCVPQPVRRRPAAGKY
jgi:hypothetical protein